MYELGKYYLTNMMILKITQRLFNGLLVQRSVANRGDIFVSRNVSVRYKRYLKDENHALHWYEKAARLGSTRRSTRLRQCMLRGQALKLIITSMDVANNCRK